MKIIKPYLDEIVVQALRGLTLTKINITYTRESKIYNRWKKLTDAGLQISVRKTGKREP